MPLMVVGTQDAHPSQRPNSVALGIDPGLHRTGYALLRGQPPALTLVEAGLVRLDRRRSLASRLADLQRDLASILSAHAPGLVVVEQLYAHYKHPRTAILMGHARGVILALAAARGLPIVDVPATFVKKLLTGSGHADKAQMQRAVAAALGLTSLPEPHDVADAMAIALAGLHRAGAGRRSLVAGARA